MSFSVLIRAATEHECVLTDQACNVTDGAAAVLVDGELIAVCNEYGTAYVQHPRAHQAQVEELVAYAMDVYSTYLPEPSAPAVE